jgi:hypothetical protein
VSVAQPAVPERKRVIEEINIVDIIDEITLYGKVPSLCVRPKNTQTILTF